MKKDKLQSQKLQIFIVLGLVLIVVVFFLQKFLVKTSDEGPIDNTYKQEKKEQSNKNLKLDKVEDDFIESMESMGGRIIYRLDEDEKEYFAFQGYRDADEIHDLGAHSIEVFKVSEGESQPKKIAEHFWSQPMILYVSGYTVSPSRRYIAFALDNGGAGCASEESCAALNKAQANVQKDGGIWLLDLETKEFKQVGNSWGNSKENAYHYLKWLDDQDIIEYSLDAQGAVPGVFRYNVSTGKVKKVDLAKSDFDLIGSWTIEFDCPNTTYTFCPSGVVKVTRCDGDYQETSNESYSYQVDKDYLKVVLGNNEYFRIVEKEDDGVTGKWRLQQTGLELWKSSKQMESCE